MLAYLYTVKYLARQMHSANDEVDKTAHIKPNTKLLQKVHED